MAELREAGAWPNAQPHADSHWRAAEYITLNYTCIELGRVYFEVPPTYSTPPNFVAFFTRNTFTSSLASPALLGLLYPSPVTGSRRPGRHTITNGDV
jgi:hypothetical protein